MKRRVLIAGGSALLITLGILGMGTATLAQTDAGRKMQSHTDSASPITRIEAGTVEPRNADVADGLSNIDADKVEELSDSLNENSDVVRTSSDRPSSDSSEQLNTNDD
jgi:hypothetical protein